MVKPVRLTLPFPNANALLQAMVAVVAGQLLYKAKPIAATLPDVVLTASVTDSLWDAVVAVKLNQTSSFCAVLVQDGLGMLCVAPLVFTTVGDKQNAVGGPGFIAMAATQLSLSGGGGTS
jgi:hypothetical protein